MAKSLWQHYRKNERSKRGAIKQIVSNGADVMFCGVPQPLTGDWTSSVRRPWSTISWYTVEIVEYGPLCTPRCANKLCTLHTHQLYAAPMFSWWTRLRQWRRVNCSLDLFVPQLLQMPGLLYLRRTAVILCNTNHSVAKILTAMFNQVIEKSFIIWRSGNIFQRGSRSKKYFYHVMWYVDFTPPLEIVLILNAI